MLRPFLPLFTKCVEETVWKIAGGFLIACVSCFKRARWDIFAPFWLLATLQFEAYWDFPDSLERGILGSWDVQKKVRPGLLRPGSPKYGAYSGHRTFTPWQTFPPPHGRTRCT
jgi:hypothetical protein